MELNPEEEAVGQFAGFAHIVHLVADLWYTPQLEY
jgi:hypothetical protein